MSEPTITPEDVRIEFGAYCQPFVRRLPMNVEGGAVVEQRLAEEVIKLRAALTLATQRAEAAEAEREDLNEAVVVLNESVITIGDERDALRDCADRADAEAVDAWKAFYEIQAKEPDMWKARAVDERVKRVALEKEVKTLRASAELLARHAGLDCDTVHHDEGHRHGLGDPCPVEAVIARALKALDSAWYGAVEQLDVTATCETLMSPAQIAVISAAESQLDASDAYDTCACDKEKTHCEHYLSSEWASTQTENAVRALRALRAGAQVCSKCGLHLQKTPTDVFTVCEACWEAEIAALPDKEPTP